MCPRCRVPPCGCGSPSPRRAWIEILFDLLSIYSKHGRPPHGGRGLKYIKRLVVQRDIFVALPTEGVD